jgi:hypothetical protein
MVIKFIQTIFAISDQNPAHVALVYYLKGCDCSRGPDRDWSVQTKFIITIICAIAPERGWEATFPSVGPFEDGAAVSKDRG